MMDDYYALILITEEEMWERRNYTPNAEGAPQYYCVTRNGSVLIHPPLNPKKFTLMCKWGVI